MTDTDIVLVEYDGAVTIVSINRPERRNAVDGATARRLFNTFLAARLTQGAGQHGKIRVTGESAAREVNSVPA
jgi:enoyl-CoA hydratase/carnithine racemase